MNEEFLECDCCKKAIFDFEDDLFHVTGIIDGKLNKHTHLCYYCFQNNVNSIPVIKEKDTNEEIS